MLTTTQDAGFTAPSHLQLLPRQETTLANMWHERRNSILKAMEGGMSFTAANRLTYSHYDTVDWGEVPSRLWRARGTILTSTARLAVQWQDLHLSDGEIEELERMAVEIRNLCQGLAVLVAQEPAVEVPLSRHASGENDVSFDATRPTTFKLIIGKLRGCRRLVSKNCHDVPLIWDKIGRRPTIEKVARSFIELSRTIRGTACIELLAGGRISEGPSAGKRRDLSAVGARYADWLSGLPRRGTRTIATHRKPDADALVATWLAERFLFAGQPCEICFVGRDYQPRTGNRFDCLVDVGRAHDPGRLLFDHKPPAFQDRNTSCAARLVGEHVRPVTKHGDKLTQLIDLTHDGDSVKRRGASAEYRKSKRTGLHALVDHVRSRAENDAMAYGAMAIWLDAKFELFPDKNHINTA